MGIGSVTIEQIAAVARDSAQIVMDAAAREAITGSRSTIGFLAGDVKPHYGISTDFGALANEFIVA